MAQTEPTEASLLPIRVAAKSTPPSRQTPDRSDSKMSIHSTAASRNSIDTLISPPKTQAYMDSLVPPSPEGFERIAQAQAEREEEQKRKKRESLQQQRASLSVEQQQERADAALKIQKTFRGYRARREMQGYSLDAHTRWVTAIREAQFRQMARPRAKSRVEGASLENGDNRDSIDNRPTSARDKWKKASMVARRAGHDDLESGSSSSSEDENASPEDKAAAKEARQKANAERKHEARMMGLQYFLEMVDLKHRYGSNLRVYHEEWKRSDTDENFFYWLDYGEGRNIELDACPRDRLEREQVRYLSREERQYYLVKVDPDGRLCWAKNGERIDTTERYKDSIHGIVPSDDPTPPFNPAAEPEPSLNSHSSSSLSSIESAREADRAAKYATPGFDESQGMKKVSYLSAATIFNKLLRKSVRKNTWIFVADTSFRLYVGIKNSGAFQHSSFLQGSRISAAGLIKVKDGRLSSLSPLSGHYRPPAANFRAFVKSLKAGGTDMSHVSISKSYAVLVGLEAYIKTRHKSKDIMGKMIHRRDKLIAPEEVQRREEEAKDKSESAEKERQVLEREEVEREENRTSVKVMQKLSLRPREPKGPRGDGDAAMENVEGETV